MNASFMFFSGQDGKRADFEHDRSTDGGLLLLFRDELWLPWGSVGDWPGAWPHQTYDPPSLAHLPSSQPHVALPPRRYLHLSWRYLHLRWAYYIYEYTNGTSVNPKQIIWTFLSCTCTKRFYFLLIWSAVSWYYKIILNIFISIAEQQTWPSKPWYNLYNLAYGY